MKIRTLANFKLSNGKIMRMGEYDDIKEPFPEEIQEEIRRAKSQAKLVVRKKRVEILDDRKREEPSLPPLAVEVKTMDSMNTLEVSDEETVLETAETGDEEQEEVEVLAPKKTRKRKK